MKSRFFNTVEIDYDRGIVRKSSTNVDKLRNEILFYIKAPSYIKRLLPKLLDYSADYSWYEMEYIEYRTLSEIALSSELSFDDWDRVLSLVANTIDKASPSCESTNLYELYRCTIAKATNRALATKNSELKKVFFSPLTINGVPRKSLSELLRLHAGVLGRVTHEVGILHGDLCFSNILVSEDLTKIRLIDPRGGFDGPSTYGPIVYDLAKLAQSVYSWYDKIVENQYELKRIGEEYELNVEPPFWSNAAPAFDKVLDRFDLTKDNAIVLAGLMLAGTPRLHLDDQDRAIALALDAILLLSGDPR